MTQTNTDFLLQVTTPVTERTYGATGINDDPGGFVDHLSQAATLSGDDSRNLGGGSQRAASARNERDDRSWNTDDFKPTSHDNGKITTSQTSPTDQEESKDEVSGPKSPIENADRDEHGTEKADDTTAAAAAGASQRTKDNAPKSNSNPDPKANENRSAAAKAALVSTKAAAEAGDRKATGKSEGQATNSASLTDENIPRTDEAAQFVANAKTDVVETNEEVCESQDNSSKSKQSKAAKSDASTTKLGKGTGKRNDGVVSDDSSAENVEPGETSPDVAQQVSIHVDSSATQAEAPAAKNKAITDKSSDDDSRTRLQNESRAGARNDESVQTNKVDTAQLAVTIASPTDTGASSGSKSKDNEQATKPITAKGEPAAAAFARMARNNITGPKDSTSGANDLPPIDPSRFIGRVAKAFQTAQDRGGTLQLRLSPPELGALRIELNVKDGVMSAALQTENANARRLLLDHLPALRDRLAEQNIRVDRFDVDVRREGTGSQTDARGSQQQQFQHQPDEPAPRRQAEPRTREIATPERTAIAPSGSETGLNLIV